MKLYVLFFLINATGNKSYLLNIDQVANLMYFPNMQLNLLYLIHFMNYGLLKSPTSIRNVLVNTDIH